MIRIGQEIDGWKIVEIDRPVGTETWVHPRGWVMAVLMDPADEFVILNLPPKDQTPERVADLLKEELSKRSQCVGKELTL